MNSVAPPLDLSSVLVPPAVPSRVEQAIQRVTDNAIPGLSQIDAVIGLLLNFSPLEEFVFKPFIGDWNAMERAAEAWPRCGQGVQLINERVMVIGSFLGDGWQGEAADAFESCHQTLGKLLSDLPFQCEQAGVMDSELAGFAKGIAEFIGEVLQGIIGYGISLVIALATPPVGTVAIVGLVASAVATITGWISSILDLFNQFLGFLEAVLAIHSGVAGLLTSVRQAVSALSLAATITSKIAGAIDTGTGIAGGLAKAGSSATSATASRTV